jgi:glycosyltransferase involved in cell wall biosynthesis
LILKKFKRAILVFNVSDLWPESVEKLGIVKNTFFLKLSYLLEGLIYRNSELVTGQTQGIVDNIKNRFSEVRTWWLSNGIDFKQFNINSNGDEFRAIMNLSVSDFVLVYAGVMGHAQGLETVIEAAEKVKSQSRIKLFLVGDGPEKAKLMEMVEKKKLQNLFFIPNVKQTEIPGIIAACDAYIVPLKRNDLFLGAVPSKLFEPLAMGKPILLGVDGEARDLFIEKGKCGLYFEPENSTELARCINILFNNKPLAFELGENGRQYIRKNFDRQFIANKFYDKLLEIMQ